MQKPQYTYCKQNSEEVLARIETFRSNVSVLPSVGLSEITGNELFNDLWEEHIPERRRWYELAAMLRTAGWERKRARSLFYIEGECCLKQHNRTWLECCI